MRGGPIESLICSKILRNLSFLVDISSEHKAVYHKKLSDYSPQKKFTGSTGGDSVNLQIEIPCKTTEAHDALHERTCCETPPPANYSGISTPDRSEVRMKESSSMIPASTLDMMDKELDSTQKESGEQDSDWSVRTRAVAKYLYDRFLDLKEQKRNENLNLVRILEGQTRSKSARFFYEILTLKGHGCIDVEQDSPYADIIISSRPQLEALVKNR